MFSLKSNLYKIILSVIGITILIAGILTFLVPSAVFPDPSWGFTVMRSMQMGGGFNLIIGPNPLDIAKNSIQFLSWWSPGQYLMPYFLKSLLSINTGQASAITVTLCSLSGLAGFYFFFKKIGFTNVVSTISLVFIICQQAFWVPFAFYNGGEALLFAFEGWFLYGCLAFEKTNFKLAVFVLLSGCVGFFCKSSFMWIYAAGLLFLWIRISANQTGVLAWIKKGLWLAVPAAVSILTIYVFYLSKGENPTTDSNGYKLAWETFGFPMASPLLAGFSVDDLLNGLISHYGSPAFTYSTTIIILFVLAILSLLLVAVQVIFIPNKNYRLFIIVFYGLSILFFGYSFLRQTNISYEARHFRLIGILIVPGIIYLVSRLKLYWQLFFVVICIGLAFKSARFAVLMHYGNSKGARGVSGLSQQFIDQPSLNLIMALDRQNTNAIFVFISADIGLEIEHNRIITFEPIADGLDPDDYTYYGHAGPLFIVLPKSYNGPKEKMIMKSFPGYTGWNVSMLSNNYVLYTTR